MHPGQLVAWLVTASTGIERDDIRTNQALQGFELDHMAVLEPLQTCLQFVLEAMKDLDIVTTSIVCSARRSEPRQRGDMSIAKGGLKAVSEDLSL